MTDEPEVGTLVFSEPRVTVLEGPWPKRIAVGPMLLESLARMRGASVDGDTIRFDIFNGTAEYRLRRDLPPDEGGATLADLVSHTRTSRTI